MKTHTVWIYRLAVLLTVSLVTNLPVGEAAQNSPTLDQVVERGAGYVETLIEELATVVMEEEYEQTYFPGGSNGAVQTELVSEFLLYQVPGSSAWVGFRDVFRVNGRQLRDRQDRLATLFQGDTASPLAQARRIAEES